MTDSSNCHVTPAEFVLPALDQELEKDQGLQDAPGYIPIKISIQKTTHSAEPIDMSDMLLLAWILMMCRFSGNQSVHCAWGYTQVPADGASTADVWVDLEGQLSDLLETIRLLRREAPLSPGLLADPDGSYMFINDAFDVSNGHSNVSLPRAILYGKYAQLSFGIVVVSSRGSRVHDFGLRTYAITQTIMAIRSNGKVRSFDTSRIVPGHS